MVTKLFPVLIMLFVSHFAPVVLWDKISHAKLREQQKPGKKQFCLVKTFPFYFDHFNLIYLFFAYILKEQNPPLNQK